jgi:hypothetical protein
VPLDARGRDVLQLFREARSGIVRAKHVDSRSGGHGRQEVRASLLELRRVTGCPRLSHPSDHGARKRNQERACRDAARAL